MVNNLISIESNLVLISRHPHRKRPPFGRLLQHAGDTVGVFLTCIPHKVGMEVYYWRYLRRMVITPSSAEEGAEEGCEEEDELDGSLEGRLDCGVLAWMDGRAGWTGRVRFALRKMPFSRPGRSVINSSKPVKYNALHLFSSLVFYQLQMVLARKYINAIHPIVFDNCVSWTGTN